MKCLTVKKLVSRMNIKLISFGLFTNDYPREFKNGNAVGEKTTPNDRRAQYYIMCFA